MIYEMKLRNSPFTKIKNGNKTIELRLYDEKRKKILVGDYIVFTNIDTLEKIKVQVTNLYLFDNFRELYSKIDNRLFGYNDNNDNNGNYKDMEDYYSKEEQDKYGVVGIEIKLM